MAGVEPLVALLHEDAFVGSSLKLVELNLYFLFEEDWFGTG